MDRRLHLWRLHLWRLHLWRHTCAPPWIGSQWVSSLAQIGTEQLSHSAAPSVGMYLPELQSSHSASAWFSRGINVPIPHIVQFWPLRTKPEGQPSGGTGGGGTGGIGEGGGKMGGSFGHGDSGGGGAKFALALPVAKMSSSSGSACDTAPPRLLEKIREGIAAWARHEGWNYAPPRGNERLL